MLGWLLGLINPLGRVAEKLADAQVAKANALTDRDKIAADVTIAQLQARQAVLVAEQGSWLTAWIRPAFALPLAVYINKLVIWDKVLGYGATDDLSPELWHLMWIVVGAYFLTRPFGKK